MQALLVSECFMKKNMCCPPSYFIMALLLCKCAKKWPCCWIVELIIPARRLHITHSLIGGMFKYGKTNKVLIRWHICDETWLRRQALVWFHFSSMSLHGRFWEGRCVVRGRPKKETSFVPKVNRYDKEDLVVNGTFPIWGFYDAYWYFLLRSLIFRLPIIWIMTHLHMACYMIPEMLNLQSARCPLLSPMVTVRIYKGHWSLSIVSSFLSILYGWKKEIDINVGPATKLYIILDVQLNSLHESNKRIFQKIYLFSLPSSLFFVEWIIWFIFLE